MTLPGFSIPSANLPVFSGSAAEARLDFSVYRGMVTRVNYVGAEENPTFDNAQVVYDLVTLGGPRSGDVYQNARVVAPLGGQFNFSERVLRAATKPYSGAGAIPMEEQDGDIVYFTFLQGVLTAPIIIGCGVSHLDLDQTGATAEDGERFVEQYNGVYTEISKTGVLKEEVRGGEFDAALKTLVPRVEEPRIVTTKDPENEVLTRTFKSGLTISLDGKSDSVKITTAGGAEITVEGAGDSIEITSAGGAAVKLSGATLELGAGSTGVLDIMSQLLQAIQGITHIGNLGVVTPPPVNVAEFVALKAKIDAIKGGL